MSKDQFDDQTTYLLERDEPVAVGVYGLENKERVVAGPLAALFCREGLGADGDELLRRGALQKDGESLQRQQQQFFTLNFWTSGRHPKRNPSGPWGCQHPQSRLDSGRGEQKSKFHNVMGGQQASKSTVGQPPKNKTALVRLLH